MVAEEIYDKACEFAEARINEGKLYDIRTEIQFSFEAGVEWALEQMQSEKEEGKDSVRVYAC